MPLSACVHFVRNIEIDATTAEIFDDLYKQNVKIAYIDYDDLSNQTDSIFTILAKTIPLEQSQHESDDLVCFLDDMITLAYRESGLVIVIDNAEKLMNGELNDFFDLIETFLVQIHHWLDLKKPCHLCFQMEKNPGLVSMLSADSRRRVIYDKNF